MGDTGIKQVFFDEAKEIFENLESDIIQLEENSGDPEIINRIFRYVHTLKGSSGIAGFTSIYEFTHKLENLLDDVRSGKLDVDDRLIDLILDGIDWIKDELFLEEHDNNESDKIKTLLIERIREYKGEPAAIPEMAIAHDRGPAGEGKSEIEEKLKTKEDINYYRIGLNFRPDIFESGIDPLMIVNDLICLGEVVHKKTDKSGIPDFDSINPEQCFLKWDILLKSKEKIDKIKDVFIFVAGDNDIVIEDVTEEFAGKFSGGTYLHEKKIGEILLEKGILSEDDLESVIEIQETKNRKFGDIIVRKGLASEQDVAEALKDQDHIKKRIENTTVRVETAKLDNLLNLLGEIVIGQAGLMGLTDVLGEESEVGSQLKNALFGIERTTREFQEQIMSIRMIPIGPTFEQFRRFVRDSAHSLGREIKLIIEGAETELDKTVIEKIGDPLKHMIRNSIDHGIEGPEERAALGKDRTGTIILRSYHQEGNVYIEIVDDGKGLDIPKIRAKAESLGYIRSGEDVPNERLYSFLFLPGFSTAEKVGNLSGRGVGMDVVRTNIEDLRGTIEIKSEKGKGTIMKIKLPLTLAIIDGMLVSIGNNIYIIPLLSVIESIQPKKEDIKTIEGKGEVILVRGEYVTFLRMYDIFGIEARHHDACKALVVIAESGNTKVGLMIDDLMGQQQIVIKSLDNYITESRAISGAAILGDGKVALIIDIHGLIEDINRV